ncbi:MAG: peroxidase-related enzyme [Acidobacteria bacterium]|jgi:uncharacterized peroxidase-related enzyme|nr:peroxidase-related enzyme [Acidobacteriota bacterium]
MAHIDLPAGLPGIRGPMTFSPETAGPMRDLAQTLLHDPHTLTSGERELIGTYVSFLNDCYYCQSCHGSTAACHLGNNEELVAQVKRDFEQAAISEKLKALLNIAGKVQRGGKYVTPADVERARQQGATDKEIHDTVLIAAAFCMFNRYVDGLGTWAPQDPELYREIGKRVSQHGYQPLRSQEPLQALEKYRSDPQTVVG